MDPSRVFLDVVVSWLHLTVMIAVSRALAFGPDLAPLSLTSRGLIQLMVMVT